MVTLRTAARPTMHFIGVTTGSSSILRVFPRWARALGLGDCELNGIDLPPRAPAEDFRAIVRFLKDDPLSLGALVTTHKLDVVAAAGDLINGLDPYAAALREVSCLSKSGSRLLGHAKDPVSSALALAAMLPEGHWRRTGAAGFVIGAGGAALAITCCLAEAERGVDRPARLVVSDRDPARLADIAATHRRLGLDLPIRYVHAASDAENAAVLPALPPHSLVINASGIGKDAPGSPLPASAVFPLNGFAWDLNYRGDLLFLDQARQQAAARQLHVEDGWIYFLHGWTRAIAEVFHIQIATHGPSFDALSQHAADARG
jgi:shikimate 5-dehydrogenase